MSDTNAAPKAPTTKDLKRVLGFGDLLGTAVGQIIGAGIMSLMGVALAITGRSAMFSFLIAAVLTCFNYAPSVFVAGTIRMRGGLYTQGALFGGKYFGGVFALTRLFQNVSMSMYALSFADYFGHFFPNANPKLVAFGVFSVFWILNMIGINAMAKIESLIVIIMCGSLAVFAVLGVSKVGPGFFDEGFMTKGILGMFQAAATLTFATGGAQVILFLGAESKNPTRDIPLAMIVSTLSVAVLYGFLAFVAAGVLPLDQVAGKPLTETARTVLPYPMFVVFMIGGAWGALASTMNSQFATYTKALLQASVDGWFPRALAYIHPKFKTPWAWLTAMYILGLIPIFTGLNIAQVNQIVLVIGNAAGLLLNLLLIRMPKVLPELWAKSKYHVSNGALAFIAIGGAIAGGVTVVLTLSTAKPGIWIANAVMLAFSLLYCYIRNKSGKINMEVSYEES